MASLAYARIQGKSALVAHFQNSSLMNEDKRCRPILFHSDGPNAGDQVCSLLVHHSLLSVASWYMTIWWLVVPELCCLSRNYCKYSLAPSTGCPRKVIVCKSPMWSIIISDTQCLNFHGGYHSVLFPFCDWQTNIKYLVIILMSPLPLSNVQGYHNLPNFTTERIKGVLYLRTNFKFRTFILHLTTTLIL